MAQGYAPGGVVLPEDQATATKKPVLKGQAPGGAGTTIQPTVPTTSTSPMPVLKPPTVTVAGQTVTKPTVPGALGPTGMLPAPATGGGTPGIQPTALPPAGTPTAMPGVFTGPGITPITAAQVPGSGAIQPGPGPTPIPPGVGAPSAPQAPANPYLTPFAPGNDLRFEQINPYADPRLRQTQSAVDAATAALSGGPDRQQMARDLFQSYLQQSSPEFDRTIREITQRNAAVGRSGSGMYGSNLVDAATQRQRDIAAYGTQLAYDTTNGAIQDRINNVSTLAGLEGQQYGQAANGRNELRGERTYQQGVAQQAQQDAINQRLLEDQLLNSASNRDLGYYGLVGNLGFGSNPAGTLGGLAGDTQQAASGAGASASDLFTQWLLSQRPAGG